MPASNHTVTFLDWVEKSGLLPATHLPAYADRAAEATPEELAAQMVRDRVLTRFQANLLLKGKYRGFFLTEKYKILDHLGTGGMGQVFLCEHLVLQRFVAVKLLSGKGEKSLPPGAVERFYREARAVAALDHRNIVRVFDVDQVRGVPFMVMEYVDGLDLHRFTDASGPLPIADAAGYTAQAAAGLQHAHEAGLVHRDIKPGNILLDRTGAVKLLDMGLARFLVDVRRNEGVTERYDENSVLGTADFIAPEQAIGAAVDIRADIYGLGCTLFYLLTGRLVFHSDSLTQKLLWHQLRAPDPVSKVRPDVPPKLSAVVARMMAKKPEERYQTPADVVAALAPWVPAQSSPPRTDILPRATAGEYTLGLSSYSGPVSASLTVTPTPGDSNAKTLSRTPRVAPRSEVSATSPSAKVREQVVEEEDPSAEQPALDATARGGRLKRGVLVFAGCLALLGAVAAGFYFNTAPPVPVAKGTFGPGVGPEKGQAGVSGAAGAQEAAVILTGSGSTLIDPLMQAWSTTYRTKSGAWVVYDAVGSGKGVQNVLDGSSEFATTETPLSESQVAHAKSLNREVVHVPLVFWAVVPTYNVPDVPTGLRFTGPLLADIFLGKVKAWNDPAVRAENPDLPLPNTPITVVTRSDPSGTTFLWTDYLSKVSPDWKGRAGAGTSVAWPVGNSVKGSEGVAAAVAQAAGAIGYVELAFALTKKLSYGAVKNRDGRYVSPSTGSLTATASAASGSIPDDFRFSLLDAPGEDSYPLTGTTWAVLTYPVGGKAKSHLVKFLEWVTHEGQAAGAKFHAAPLPSSLVMRISTRLSLVTR